MYILEFLIKCFLSIIIMKKLKKKTKKHINYIFIFDKHKYIYKKISKLFFISLKYLKKK